MNRRRLGRGLAAFIAILPVTPVSAQVPAGAFILPEAVAPSLLRQCSRPVPGTDRAFWTPAPEAIVEAESSLVNYLRDRRAEGWELPFFPGEYTRQYIGHARNGRKYIYGNSVRATPRVLEKIPPATEALVMCDGGVHAFGFEYDVGSRKITGFAVNGPYVPILIAPSDRP